ncbi:MAG TPA: ribulose 1,5-bisphosphate carboxylase large subunit [bacterium]|nr:ribulose 1,5-bisphosphate carboxylase large subunit [bacterium]
MEKQRFSVTYSITTETSTEKEARHKAFDICVEQTVEFPYELITDTFIREEVVGRFEAFKRDAKDKRRFIVEISYHNHTVGKELSQFLNVLFGNTSLKPGIKIESIRLSGALAGYFKGPRFGISGVKKLTGSRSAPLLCSAIKPMGQSPRELASLAEKFALGCVDIIKDDHGLSDQPFAPFKARIAAVSEAVRNAVKKTGKKTLYAPNVTADTTDEVMARARFAKKSGASALVISGALAGFGTVRRLSTDKSLNLPVLLHPAFTGSFTAHSESGISHFALFGQLARICGADISIFPNFGGRFSFSKEACKAVMAGCKTPMHSIKPALPGPGGGMSVESMREMKKFYGSDAVFLIGGGLFRHKDGITGSCREVRERLG